jgi:Tfp pilus assembly protein PilW
MMNRATNIIRNMMTRTSGQGGFSFAEIIVVVLISTFLIGGIYTVLSTGKNSWEINRDRLEVQQELRKGLDWMRRDLRQAGVSTVTGVPTDGTPYVSIVFQMPSGVAGGVITWGATVQYTIAGGQLIRTTGGANRVIAQDFNTLQFRRTAASPNIVQITATARKNTPQHGLISMTVTTQERMRN